MLTHGIPKVADHPGLVVGDPVLDPVTQLPAHDVSEVREPIDNVPVRPPPRVLERLGQIPVVQRHPGRDAALEQTVDNAVIEGEPVGVGVDSRPVARIRGHAIENRYASTPRL